MPESFTELRQNDYQRMCTGVPSGRICEGRPGAAFARSGVRANRALWADAEVDEPPRRDAADQTLAGLARPHEERLASACSEAEPARRTHDKRDESVRTR